MVPHNSAETEEGSISLQISDLQRISENGSVGSTMFQPQTSSEKRDRNTSASVGAPEKKLTLFALRLAVLEKLATNLGTLGFIWATVVLLGGFAITLDQTDFWFITIILLIEGARIFSRSRELEWQHQATWSITDVGINSFRAIKISSSFIFRSIKEFFKPIVTVGTKNRSSSTEINTARNLRGFSVHEKNVRTWTSSEVPIIPYAQWIFRAKHISKLLNWLQLLSASACVSLSLIRLIKHNYGDVEKGDTDKRNRKAALSVFYSLALAEALLFLLEKSYWEYKVSYCKLLVEVNNECELGSSGLVTITRFFYDAYSRCVNGSIFDGLKMDMVTFGMDLLCSNSADEQLIGAKILRQFSMSPRYSDDTLQKIGINLSVIERLVEILNWSEEKIRKSAAEILSKLAAKKQNSIRIAGIPGAMESISSLLQSSRSLSQACDEINEKRTHSDHTNYGLLTFNHLGLLILKKLARDHDNSGKIGNTRGLLAKIIDFTHAEEQLLHAENATPDQLLTLKRSLQLVKRLVSTTCNTGKNLRREISEIIFTISNIRDILRHGEKHQNLQILGIEILTSLALEQEATEIIGRTGGMLKELFNIFLKTENEREEIVVTCKEVINRAGEALAMLVLESKNNCHRIFKLRVVDSLVAALDSPLIRINAARILRNLRAYSGVNCFNQLKGIANGAPTVLKYIMTEDHKLKEVTIGLAPHVLSFLSPEELSLVFERAGVTEARVAHELVESLRKYRQPRIKVPRMRRFVIELANWMMKDKHENVQTFKGLGIEHELELVLETTDEMESFNIFSGTVGMSRHNTTIHVLVETTLELLTSEMMGKPKFHEFINNNVEMN